MQIINNRVLIFFSLLFLNSCKNTCEKNIFFRDIWTINEEVNFLNQYEYCGLGQEIEFLPQNYFVYKTKCNSERPYGLIKVGYYEIKKDSIYFFNEYHSIMTEAKIKEHQNDKLKLVYQKHTISNSYKIISTEYNLNLIRKIE
jgi:hypothetical protein